MSRDAPTLAELLRAKAIRRTRSASGTTPPSTTSSPSADRASWPLQRGFDRFYGFIGGETHYFAPAQLVEDNAFVDRDAYRADYYCSDDWTDTAIRWLKAHVARRPTSRTSCICPTTRRMRRCMPSPRISRATRACTTRAGTPCARRGSSASARWACMRAPRRCRRAALACPRGTTSRPRRRGALRALHGAVCGDRRQHRPERRSPGGPSCDALGRLDNTLVVVTSDNGANGIGGVDGAVEQSRQAPDAHAKIRTSCAAMLETGRLGGPAYVARVSARMDRRVVHAVPAVQDDDDERRHPRAARRALACRHRDARRDPPPVAARHRHGADAARRARRRRIPSASTAIRTRALDGVSARPAPARAAAASARRSSTTSSPATAATSATAGRSFRCSRPARRWTSTTGCCSTSSNDATEMQDLARRIRTSSPSSSRRSTPMRARTTSIRSTIATCADR